MTANASVTAHIRPAQAILEFWLQDGLLYGWPTSDLAGLWFGGGAELDADIQARFGSLVHDAVAGGLHEWEKEPLSRLALVILLDQFTRNVFRRQARAFAGDPRAQSLVQETLALGWDKQLPACGRVFLYLPLTHAEQMPLQQTCVHSLQQLQDECAPEHRDKLNGFVKSAHEHRDIIARFGRFPHRNAVLGRRDTPAEAEFLQNAPRFGQ